VSRSTNQVTTGLSHTAEAIARVAPRKAHYQSTRVRNHRGVLHFAKSRTRGRSGLERSCRPVISSSTQAQQ